MSRRMPMAPVPGPPGSGRGEAWGVGEWGGVEGGGDDLAAGAAWVEACVARHPLGHHLAQGRRELPRLFRADEARQRLLDQLVRAETEQFRHRVVGLEDLALEV